MGDPLQRARGPVLLPGGAGAGAAGARLRRGELRRAGEEVQLQPQGPDPAGPLRQPPALRTDEHRPVLPARGGGRVHRVPQGPRRAAVQRLLRRLPARHPARARPRLPGPQGGAPQTGSPARQRVEVPLVVRRGAGRALVGRVERRGRPGGARPAPERRGPDRPRARPVRRIVRHLQAGPAPAGLPRADLRRREAGRADGERMEVSHLLADVPEGVRGRPGRGHRGMAPGSPRAVLPGAGDRETDPHHRDPGGDEGTAELHARRDPGRLPQGRPARGGVPVRQLGLRDDQRGRPARSRRGRRDPGHRRALGRLRVAPPSPLHARRLDRRAGGVQRQGRQPGRPLRPRHERRGPGAEEAVGRPGGALLADVGAGRPADRLRGAVPQRLQRSLRVAPGARSARSAHQRPVPRGHARLVADGRHDRLRLRPDPVRPGGGDEPLPARPRHRRAAGAHLRPMGRPRSRLLAGRLAYRLRQRPRRRAGPLRGRPRGERPPRHRLRGRHHAPAVVPRRRPGPGRVHRLRGSELQPLPGRPGAERPGHLRAGQRPVDRGMALGRRATRSRPVRRAALRARVRARLRQRRAGVRRRGEPRRGGPDVLQRHAGGPPDHRHGEQPAGEDQPAERLHRVAHLHQPEEAPQLGRGGIPRAELLLVAAGGGAPDRC